MQQHSTHAHAQRFGGLLLVCMLQRLAADFAYIDFNSTAGLTFNGVATTSSCADGHAYNYSVAHGTNDATGGELGTGYHLETTSTIVDESFDTHTAPQLRTATRYEAAFPHRTDALTSPTSPCPVRLRYAIMVCVCAMSSSAAWHVAWRAYRALLAMRRVPCTPRAG